jgi:hypothetical protein
MSFSAWSQAAQQQAQSPIVVQVQMPPESIWATLVKLAVPTILGAGLGAGLTLYGVGKTNKHNAAENAANREHAAKMRDWETKQTAKREHYEALITEFLGLEKAARELETKLSSPSPERHKAVEGLREQLRSFKRRVNISYLFIPVTIIESLSRALDAFSEAYDVPEDANAAPTFASAKTKSFKDEFNGFVIAARKDLGYED